MPRYFRFRVLTPFALLLMAAADPSWKVKQTSQWSTEDARQLLTASPWVKKTRIAAIPARGEDQLREGGRMGGAGSAARGHEGAMNRDVMIRWESAMPVRIAEAIAHETDAPDWDGDYYVIAAYEVPGISAADRKSVTGDLRKMAILKRDGKKDLRPSRVDIVPLPDNLVRIVYLFPRSVLISADDKRIEFVAQIGRLTLTQQFSTDEMQLQGKLEL